MGAGWARWARGAFRRRSACALWAVLVALWALWALRVPREATLSAELPQHEPAAVAHLLADFSNHPKLYTHISGSWKIEEEWSNYTDWRYAVSYECGERCEGRAEVRAGGGEERGGGAPRHGASALHRVYTRDTRCVRATALPWPRACEYIETQIIVKPRAGGGTHLEERAVVGCSALATVLSGCDAFVARRAHLRALQQLLAQQSG